jgi:hypothetical protein
MIILVIAISILIYWSISRLNTNSHASAGSQYRHAWGQHMERIQRDSLRSPYHIPEL